MNPAKRASLVAEARQIEDDAEREGRSLTAAEASFVANLWSEVDRIEEAGRISADNDATWTSPND